MHLQNAFKSHTDSTHVSVEQTNSLLVISSQTLRKTWTCGMQVFVSISAHLHCKRHDKPTRREIIANKKERKKSTLHYLQLTSRACRARSSLAASLPPAVSWLGVFKKKPKKHDIHEANIRVQMITDLINCLDFFYRAKKKVKCSISSIKH